MLAIFIHRLSVGEGLWRIANRAFRVQHQITPAEHHCFETTAAMLRGQQ